MELHDAVEKSHGAESWMGREVELFGRRAGLLGGSGGGGGLGLVGEKGGMGIIGEGEKDREREWKKLRDVAAGGLV